MCVTIRDPKANDDVNKEEAVNYVIGVAQLVEAREHLVLIKGNLDRQHEAVVAGKEDDEHVPRLQVPVLKPKYAFLKQLALLVLKQLQVLPLLLVEEEADLEVIERFIHLLRKARLFEAQPDLEEEEAVGALAPQALATGLDVHGLHIFLREGIVNVIALVVVLVVVFLRARV